MPTPGYKNLPHTTDAYIEASGSTFEAALEYAGQALFDTMCDLKSISVSLTEKVDATGSDEVRLTYDWLEKLLLKFELEHKVYSKFKVKLTGTPSAGFHLAGIIYGEPYDRKKHVGKVEVKAVTFHKMEIVREGATTTLRFILDL